MNIYDIHIELYSITIRANLEAASGLYYTRHSVPAVAQHIERLLNRSEWLPEPEITTNPYTVTWRLPISVDDNLKTDFALLCLTYTDSDLLRDCEQIRKSTSKWSLTYL